MKQSGLHVVVPKDHRVLFYFQSINLGRKFSLYSQLEVRDDISQYRPHLLICFLCGGCRDHVNRFLLIPLVALQGLKLEAAVEDFWRMSQGPNRNEVYSRFRDLSHILERDVARGLKPGPPGSHSHCFTHFVNSHVIEQYSPDAEIKSDSHIVERSRLDLNFQIEIG